MKHYRIMHMSDILRESAPIGAPNEEKEAEEMKENKIYKCPYCGNKLLVIEDGGVTPVCCGSEMELLEAESFEEVTDGLEGGGKHAERESKRFACFTGK